MYIDEKKYQMHLTGILSLTPGDHGWFLDLLKADTATFTGEAVGIRYPGVSPDKRYTRNIGGVDVMQAPAAGYGFWKDGTMFSTAGAGPVAYNTVAGVGDANSFGITVDFNWAYDNKIIKGWTVIPGITYFRALQGNTPTLTANYLQGAQVDEHVRPVQSERADPLAGGAQLHELLGDQPAAGRQGLHRWVRHPQLLMPEPGRRLNRGAGPGNLSSTPDGGSRPKSMRGGGREPCC